MRRLAVVLALLLVLFSAGSAGFAQVATPFASPPPVSTTQVDLAGVTPLPLTGERRAVLEAYATDLMHRLGVPGAAIAIVQGGEVVYLQGLGLRDLNGTAPVTADTLMMIGSVNKSMTSTMAATLVDDGWISWDTRLVDLLPTFAVSDPERTSNLTIADAFCACTGLPRHDPELLFNFNDLPPEKLITSVADMPLTAPLGEKFQYSNQMYAIGGYAATARAGAAPDDLLHGYQLLIQDQLLNPLGMDRSTFSLDEVLASGDYAHPYAASLDGHTAPVPLLTDQGFVTSVAPAGGLWSSARDMARYVQMELADGVAPDGTRVVSAENLDRTRAPRVPIEQEPGGPPFAYESSQAYAMGWVTGAYKGQPLISHNGGTFGFGSQVAFLPEADLGLVILTNDVVTGGPFTLALQYRLFELLFDQPSEIDPLLSQLFEQQAQQLAQIQAQLGQADPAAVGPYLGRYTNPALGEIQLRLEGSTLILDGGEIRSALRPLMDEAGNVVAYVFTDAPLAGAPAPIMLQQDANGQPEIVVSVEGEGAATYTFTRLEGGAATPAP
jgi:CubicO group peptidase (beta-lactamase class C family)